MQLLFVLTVKAGFNTPPIHGIQSNQHPKNMEISSTAPSLQALPVHEGAASDGLGHVDTLISVQANLKWMTEESVRLYTQQTV